MSILLRNSQYLLLSIFLCGSTSSIRKIHRSSEGVLSEGVFWGLSKKLLRTLVGKLGCSQVRRTQVLRMCRRRNHSKILLASKLHLIIGKTQQGSSVSSSS